MTDTHYEYGVLWLDENGEVRDESVAADEEHARYITGWFLADSVVVRRKVTIGDWESA